MPSYGEEREAGPMLEEYARAAQREAPQEKTTGVNPVARRDMDRTSHGVYPRGLLLTAPALVPYDHRPALERAPTPEGLMDERSTDPAAGHWRGHLTCLAVLL